MFVDDLVDDLDHAVYVDDIDLVGEIDLVDDFPGGDCGDLAKSVSSYSPGAPTRPPFYENTTWLVLY